METKESKEFPEEGEVLFGTVTKIVGTSVFVMLDDYDEEGVISFSELAPGRIRNIRDYVKIGQKTVVKVLRVNPEKAHIDLSLRRVSQKERQEVLEEYKKEKEFEAVLRLIMEKERAAEITKKIKRKIKFTELLSKIAAMSREIEELLSASGMEKQEIAKLEEIAKEKIKEKKVVVKSKIFLTSDAEDGIEKIKRVLIDIENNGANISYIGAANYLVSVEAKDYKEANTKLKGLLDVALSKAKENNCVLEIVER